MNSRDDLLFYARYLSDERVHKMVGKCLSEGGRQNTAAEPETVTPTERTTLAALLLDLPGSAVSDLLKLAQGMKDAIPDSLTSVNRLLSLRPAYAHMVALFAQSLQEAQTAIEPPQEVGAV